MAVATGILVAAGISAAASAYAAHKQGEANEQATRAAEESGDKSLKFQEEELAYQKQKDEDQRAYERQQTADKTAYERARAAPYIGASTGALNSLSSLLGIPAPSAPTGGYAGPSSQTSTTVGGTTIPFPAPYGSQPPSPRVMASGSLANFAGGPPQASAGPMGGGGQSSYVQLQAPDGSTRSFSAAEADQLRQKHPELQIVS